MVNQPSFGLTVGTENALTRAQDFGVNFVDLHFGGDEKALIKTLDLLDGKDLGYLANFEKAPLNWSPSEELKQVLAASPGFLGFMMDEADHMQINAHWPVIAYYGYNQRHYLAETEGLDLERSRQAVIEALNRHRAALSVDGVPPVVEFLFPVMMHTVAQAGINLSPKILKETCGPAMLAVALGAAKQYDVDFSIDVDYWWHNETLGHSLERFRSALLLAYWSGASKIYVEGGATWSRGHPLGSQIEAAYKHFLDDYIPAHPRPYDWRDYQPEIAIIRYDDTCFDTRQAYLGEFPGPLFGHVPVKAENVEWLNVWSLLSHGFTRTDSLSHQWETRRFNCRTLFVPLHNVVVYDHEVDQQKLRGIKLIFLTGVKISQKTMDAVVQMVNDGAVCVIPPRLAPLDSGFNSIDSITRVSDGKGFWLVVPEFYSLHYEAFYGGPANKILRDALQGRTGDGDHLVYHFGDYNVRFAQAGGDYPRHEIMTCYLPLTQYGADPDRLEVEVSAQ